MLRVGLIGKYSMGGLHRQVSYEWVRQVRML